MANYFINNDEKQKTPTGTVTPTVQPNGKTEAPADAKKITTPVGGDAVNTPVQQQAVVQGANNVQQQAQGTEQATPQQPAQPQNYFAPNTATADATQGESQEQSGEDEGLSDDEKAWIAMNDAIQNNYRKQYKQASDVTQGVFDYLNGGSEKEEEPYRKKNNAKEKIYALADAIRQIGNLAYVTKGATPQKFNNPVAEQEAKYQQEKALRDKDRAARADAAQKKAKMDADAAYKDALLAMKNNEFNRNVFNDYRKAKENADKFAWNQRKDLANLDLQGKRLNETARHNKTMEGLSAQRVAIAASNAATSRMRAVYEIQGSGGLGKGSKTYTTPEGVTYTLSKNFINPANVKTVYDKMCSRGVISSADQQAVKKSLDDVKAGMKNGGNGGNGTSAMLSAILSAATSSEKGHQWFTYFGNRLGYKYRGGMSNELKGRLIKTNSKPASQKSASKPQQKKEQPKPQAKAPSKPQQKSAAKPQQQEPASKPAPSKPQQSKPAAKKPSQSGGQNKSGVGKSHNGYKHTKALGL